MSCLMSSQHSCQACSCSRLVWLGVAGGLHGWQLLWASNSQFVQSSHALAVLDSYLSIHLEISLDQLRLVSNQINCLLYYHYVVRIPVSNELSLPCLKCPNKLIVSCLCGCWACRPPALLLLVWLGAVVGLGGGDGGIVWQTCSTRLLFVTIYFLF